MIDAFLPILAGVLGAAVVGFAAITPWLRPRKPDLWKEIGLRIAAWIGIAVVLIGALWLGRVWWIVVLGVLGILVMREYVRAVGLWADRGILTVLYLFVVALHVVAWWPYPNFFPIQGWYGLFQVLPMWGIVALTLVPILRGSADKMLQKLALSIFGMVYFGWFLGHASFMVNLSHGTGPVLWLAFLVAVNDVAAFIAGKLFGKHRLRARLSPGKTIEGSIGSLLVVVAVGTAMHAYVPFPMWGAALVAALVSLCAVLGDLTTSVIKRDLGIKDWSHALPGHGGFLDRTNSLIYAAPVFFHTMVFFYGL